MSRSIKFQTGCAKWHEDSEGLWVSFKVKSLKTAIGTAQEVQEKLFNVEVKEHKKKRSSDANKYAWVLLDELAEVTGEPKTEVYKSFIREIGGNNDFVCVKNEAKKRVQETWSMNGIGYVTEEFDSQLEGCTNLILYYGSSTYDTAQMNRLINLIVDECKAHDIETLPPEELCKLKGLMDE